MTTEMFEQLIRPLLRKEPFQPFEVELDNGDRFVVDVAEAFAFSGGAAGFLPADGSVRFIDCKAVRRLNGFPAEVG